MPKGTQKRGATSLLNSDVRLKWSNAGIKGKIAIRARDAGDTAGRNHSKGIGSKLRDIAKSGEIVKKWYSLIDKVYNIGNLKKSYQMVRANKGAPGIDGVTVAAYGENLEERLNKLHYEL